MAYFEINNLVVKHKTFEGVKTVLDIDHLQIEKGESFGLVGESGQGKTILALTIQQLLQTPPGIIESGSVTLDGVELLSQSKRSMQKNIRGQKIAMIFQDPMSCLNPVFTIEQIMVDVLRQNHKEYSKKMARERAMQLLEEVKLADASSVLLKYPHQLSGGQRQRVIIALALCCGAEFLIADEPTRNLDVTIQASILKLLKELQESHNITVLFIANNLSLVSAFCDRVAVIHDSKIVEEGDTQSVIHNPQNDYTKLLLDAGLPESEKNTSDPDKEPLLRIEHLKKYFQVTSKETGRKKLDLKAVDDVSFSLRQGEVLGIVGESGCGKSTLVNTLLGLFDPTDGDVWFEGRNVFKEMASGRNKNAFKKNVQIVFQDPYWSLNPRWLIKDIIAEPIDVYDKLGEADRLKRVEELLEMVGMPKSSAYKYPHEFSGGQRQRIAIARALASNPKLVVLDEPTSSIDVFSQAHILDLLMDLKKKFNLTNILISHDLGVVHALSDVIAVMYLGKIVEFGPADVVFNNPKHPYTKALFDSIPTPETVGVESLKTLEGQIPSPINPPSGCAFHTRCAYACDKCSLSYPDTVTVSEQHYVACHRVNEIDSEE